MVGPFNRISGGHGRARSNDEIDAAVLDVNLGGELVYPLAEMRSRARVPFIFVTGYGAESIDRRYADVPILQKPIERQTLQRLFESRQASPAKVMLN